jgi:DNA-binding PadR family transcriptional regulator
MKAHDISVLGYALLGLIHHKPSSGYDLRKIFAETAMGNYSSSPGAIYPALERLESHGLVLGVVENTAGLRRRRLYKLTAKGTSELKKWLARPIEQADVMRGAQELMLRFSFMERALSAKATIAFLSSFRTALRVYLAGLESYLRENAANMPLSGRLAVESGIRGYRSLTGWASHAIRAYRVSQLTPPARHTKTKRGGRR